ncbi:hypothetical protein NQT62_10935 [Limnobacter humi]|uniref:EfeO-type cupredoxin-like domain-containing protein n=1 Tax=Limnobacter humi TaxID=1778671 RepID=A0ABT1WIT2_9BURK|nr:hypothetical protein [Limnobacter humi]MCQ8896946.1 hypothetical protein [Limnobacter humi]
MNKRALVYLALVSAVLARAFLYIQSLQTPAPAPASARNAPTGESAQALPQLTVLSGKLTSEPIRFTTTVGGKAEFLVFTDQADELHVHGIDQTIPLPAGQTTRVSIPVKDSGAFEMELHHAEAILGVIESYPK